MGHAEAVSKEDAFKHRMAPELREKIEPLMPLIKKDVVVHTGDQSWPVRGKLLAVLPAYYDKKPVAQIILDRAGFRSDPQKIYITDSRQIENALDYAKAKRNRSWIPGF
ncbi:MAG: hypothetical protein AAB573_00460 [Patescibacteria group bacterium]